MDLFYAMSTNCLSGPTVQDSLFMLGCRVLDTLFWLCHRVQDPLKMAGKSGLGRSIIKLLKTLNSHISAVMNPFEGRLSGGILIFDKLVF